MFKIWVVVERSATHCTTRSIEPVRKEFTRKGKDGNKTKATRWGSKQPVTYNFNLKNDKVYINATLAHLGAEIFSSFTQMIETRCNRAGVELIKVEPAYTSVIGITKYMAMYGLNSGCAAALVIARRGQGRIEKLPLDHARYFRKPEDSRKSRAWQIFAYKIKLCGARLRHYWYSGGTKQARSNSPVHGKLRQTCRSMRQTVQVLRTPHIHKKTCANGFLGIST